MADFLQGSGAISMSDINAIWGLGNNLNAYRGKTWYKANGTSGVFSSGAISFSDFYSTGPAPNTLEVLSSGVINGAINTATPSFTVPFTSTAGSKLVILGIAHASQGSGVSATATITIGGTTWTRRAYSQQGDKNCGIHANVSSLTGNQTASVTLTASSRGAILFYLVLGNPNGAGVTNSANAYNPGGNPAAVPFSIQAGGVGFCIGSQINGSIVGGAQSGWTLLGRQINNTNNGAAAYRMPSNAANGTIAWPNDPYTAEAFAAWAGP